VWTKDCGQTFTRLKESLASTPVLHYYSPDLPTRMETDASEQTSYLNKLAGYAVFCGARAFSLFEESAMLDFYAALKPSYKIPSSKTMILGVVSDECYSETFLEVLQAIHNTFSINIS
jgi:hypothetical protein